MLKRWQSTGYAPKPSIVTGRARAFRQAVRAVALPGIDGDPFRVVSPVTLSFDVDRQETGTVSRCGACDG